MISLRFHEFQLHPQLRQGGGQVLVLDQNVIGNVQMHRGEIPDGLHTAGDQAVADILGAVRRNGNDADADLIALAEGLQPCHGIDGLPLLRQFPGGLKVKACHHIQSGLIKAVIIQQRTAQLPGAHNDGTGFRGEVQVFLNIQNQLLPAASGPAPSRMGDLRQILAHLHLAHTQGIGQGGSGNMGGGIFRHALQVAQIAGQTLQHRLGNFSSFHSFIFSKYLNKSIKASLNFEKADVPPIAEIEGVDLVTEGVITVNKVLEYAKDYLGENEHYEHWSLKRDGASLISRLLFEEATDINFYVGRAINPAHQNPDLPIRFSIKMNLVEELSECLRKMGKRIKVSYF